MIDANLTAVLYAKRDVRLEARPLPTLGDGDVLGESDRALRATREARSVVKAVVDAAPHSRTEGSPRG